MYISLWDGADITGITTNEKLADQYASHCVLALPLVGNNGDVSTSIACTSSTKAITSNGTVAASNVESNIYSGSFLFDGDSDYFTLPLVVTLLLERQISQLNVGAILKIEARMII